MSFRYKVVSVWLVGLEVCCLLQSYIILGAIVLLRCRHSCTISFVLIISVFLLVDACTIMSYNILADNNARNHPDLYLDVPWDALRWDSRRRLIIHEIRHWDSDLVCLQARTQPANWRCHPSTVLCNTLCLENRRWIDSGKSLQK